jgi:hypothetical protein
MTPAPRRERISPSTRSGAARAGSSRWCIARGIADHPVRPWNPHVDRRSARRITRRSRQRERSRAGCAHDGRGREGRGESAQRVCLVYCGPANGACAGRERGRSAHRARSSSNSWSPTRGIARVCNIRARRSRLGGSKHDRHREPGEPLRYGRDVEAWSSSSSVVTYVPKSYPGIEMRGIAWPITRSIDFTIAISSAHMKVYASPVVAARPVRPMRCT